jgi:hypothetical protein
VINPFSLGVVERSVPVVFMAGWDITGAVYDVCVEGGVWVRKGCSVCVLVLYDTLPFLVQKRFSPTIVVPKRLLCLVTLVKFMPSIFAFAKLDAQSLCLTFFTLV